MYAELIAFCNSIFKENFVQRYAGANYECFFCGCTPIQAHSCDCKSIEYMAIMKRISAQHDESKFTHHLAGDLVAADFPPCGCVACELKTHCTNGEGMRCTPKERLDSRRIVWVRLGSIYAPPAGSP